MIYMDAASTAELSDIDDIIIDEITKSMQEYWYNPSSLYSESQATKEKINECRSNIAKFINAKPEEIYFTSSGSETNNWVLQGFVKQCKKEGKLPYIITSDIEHSSILECLKSFDMDVQRDYVPVDKYGTIDIDYLKKLLELNRCNKVGRYEILVSIQFANNEIGTIQSIKRIAEIVHAYDGIFHTDAVQVFGKYPIDVTEDCIDLMTVSGHKISPVLKGTAFLYKKDDVNIQPLIHGSQENELRGGTENTFGIIGLSKAVEYCNTSFDNLKYKTDVRNELIKILEERFNCKLNGLSGYRLDNNINVTLPNTIGESLLYTLDLSNVYISTGSACNAKYFKPSHVLKAIGLTDEEAMRTVRITLPDLSNYTIGECMALFNVFLYELEKAVKITSTEE